MGPKHSSPPETVETKTAALSATDALRMMDAAPDMLEALRGARLMLYAWKGSRQRDGYGPHPELDKTIAEIEAVMAKAAP